MHEKHAREGHPSGMRKGDHSRHKGHDHKRMIEDFKRRLVLSTILTMPVLFLSPHVQQLLGFEIRFPGSGYVVFLLASVVYFYGGYPFFKGLKDEL